MTWMQRVILRWQDRVCLREGFPCSVCPNGVNFRGWGTPVFPYLRWRGRCRWVPLRRSHD